MQRSKRYVTCQHNLATDRDYYKNKCGKLEQRIARIDKALKDRFHYDPARIEEAKKILEEEFRVQTCRREMFFASIRIDQAANLQKIRDLFDKLEARKSVKDGKICGTSKKKS